MLIKKLICLIRYRRKRTDERLGNQEPLVVKDNVRTQKTPGELETSKSIRWIEKNDHKTKTRVNTPKTSCARGDTICPRPSPPPWAPKRLVRRRADAT